MHAVSSVCSTGFVVLNFPMVSFVMERPCSTGLKYSVSEWPKNQREVSIRYHDHRAAPVLEEQTLIFQHGLYDICIFGYVEVFWYWAVTFVSPAGFDHVCFIGVWQFGTRFASCSTAAWNFSCEVSFDAQEHLDRSWETFTPWLRHASANGGFSK